MKKILLIVILALLICPGVGASEIFGQISTNPNTPAGGQNNPPAEEPAEEPVAEQPPAVPPEPAVENRRGAVILPPSANRRPIQAGEIQLAAPAGPPKAEVLGVKIYPDNSLLRASDRKIYVVQGQAKKHIASLKELGKYRGRAILEATAEELSGYADRGHLDGELVRQRGDVKVYVIIKGSKRHILNLEELRAHYFGLEIFNISREQMALY